MDKQPNILFVLTDQQRPDWLEMNPQLSLRTPYLRRLAERGAWYQNAVCPSPLCVPSRACLSSGNEYDRCGVRSNNAPYHPEQTPYQRRLREEAGYWVMGCGKFHTGLNTDADGEFIWGLDGSAAAATWGYDQALFNAGKNQAVLMMEKSGRPRDAYMTFLQQRGEAQIHIDDYVRRRGQQREDIFLTTFPTQVSETGYFDNWITANALDLLDGAPCDRPWFLEVHYQNPHHPWDITEAMHQWYRDPDVDFPHPEYEDGSVPAQVHQEVRRNYAAMVEHLDACLGRLVAKLEERGELDNTLVVFSSDHGEMLGDYGQWQKLSPLQASVGVPLVVAGPGVAQQAPSQVPVTTLDLHATFLDLAGVDPGAVDSRSMRSLWDGQTERHRDVVLSGLSGWRMAYDGRYKLIRGYDPGRRTGGHEWEPMAVAPQQARVWQQERPLLLFDTLRNERDNLAAQLPEAVARLDAYLQE
ncbi:MAG: sulfatase-like hydrolase/transferase [Candidatus Latescibacteria bacterium]|nr:sulfatase-like hydrolase/transferase [Candidatus Latescibacterota bacterium]